MATTRAAHRYAKALMDMSKEEGSFDSVVDDIQTIRATIASSHDLRNFLASPIIDVRKKAAILREIFGGKVGVLMDRFIALLTSKGRAVDLKEIVDAFRVLLDRERNIVVAKITTAVELDAAQKERIESKIKEMSGSDVRAEYSVDPSLIGGFSARFGDKMIDASVRHQLERLRTSFIEGAMN